MTNNHDHYWYIASPYTHPDASIREARFLKVMDFTAWLVNTYRMWAFSPIMHSHQMGLVHKLPHTFDFWLEWNHAMIVPCYGMIILQIEGWNSSKGVMEEISFAESIGKPITYSRNVWGAVYDHSL